MEMIGYAVKSGFYECMKQNHSFLDQLSKLSKEQIGCILDTPNENELCERAVQFFHNEAIYLDNHTIYYENKLIQATYAMTIDSYQIFLIPHDGNPFVPFLQRIYRNLVVIHKKESL